MKWCTACKTRHDRSAFGIDATRGDGLHASCRASRATPRKSITARIAAKSKPGPNGCVEWTGSLTAGGYGHIWYEGRLELVHRVTYEIANGPIPKMEGHHGACVCHRCDNRLCINPEHLFIGSHADNMADMMAKGRWKPIRGAANPHAKLTEAQAEQIRSLRGIRSQREIAEMFGVSKTAVRYIQQGRLWRVQQFPEVPRG